MVKAFQQGERARNRLIAFLLRGGGVKGQLLRGGVGSLAIKFGYVALQLTNSILLARLLQPEGYGVYSYVLALAGILAIPGHLGFPNYLVRTVAVYRERGDVSLLRGLVIRSLQIVGAASLGVAAVASLVILVSNAESRDFGRPALLAGMLLLPLYALGEAISGALRGLGHVLIGQVPEQLLRPLLFGGLLLTAEFITPTLAAEHAILANVCSAFLTVFCGLALLWSAVKNAVGQSPPQMATRKWLLGALPFSLLAAAQLLNHHTDVIMIGHMLGDRSVGLYRVAAQVGDGLNMVLMAITVVIAPHLATFHSRGDWFSIQRLLVSAHRLGVGLIVPIVLVLMFGNQLLIKFAFGEAYLDAAKSLLILAIGKIFYATVGFSGIALSMIGRAGIATGGNLLVTALNVALNYMLIPLYGIEGAALATAISAFVVNALLALWIRVKYHRSITAIGRITR